MNFGFPLKNFGEVICRGDWRLAKFIQKHPSFHEYTNIEKFSRCRISDETIIIQKKWFLLVFAFIYELSISNFFFFISIVPIIFIAHQLEIEVLLKIVVYLLKILPATF